MIQMNTTTISLKKESEKDRTIGLLSNHAGSILHIPLINVLAFDVSYRNTGWAIIRYEHEKRTIVSYEFGLVSTPKTEFHSFYQYAKYAKEAKGVGEQMYRIESRYNPHVVLYEMPHITQDAMSAILIGMMWTSVHKRFNGYYIEPRYIKEWSGSKKGDGKDVVREMVLSKLGSLPSKNDNIIDAFANALFFIDVIKYTKKNVKQNKKTAR